MPRSPASRRSFKQNVLKATAEGAVVVDNVRELDGLSSGQIGAAAQAAAARGLGGKWVIALQNTTNQPVLTQLTNRALRERIYKASIERGRAGATDNTAVIAQLVKLRAERAALLGYPTHAAYQLEDESAGTPQAVRDMISQVAPAALARARAEASDIQKLIDAQAAARGEASFTLQPWDWFYYAEQVRKARYDFDQAQVAPYFELDRVLTDGVFFAAHAALRHHVQGAHRPAALPGRRAHLRSLRRGRRAAGAVYRGLLRPRQQAGRGLDEQPTSRSRNCCSTCRWSPII